jgi:hypothetical protein
MEYIISVILSIIGNLLTPTAKKILRWPAEPNDPQPFSPPEITESLSEDHKELIRAYNRERLERASRIIWIHGITFFFLFGAFYLPLLLKSMSSLDIPFSATRLAILDLDMSFNHERTGWFSFALALLFYVPLWLLSQSLGHVVSTIWDQLQKVTPARYASLIALSFFALSFIVAGHWVYVLFPQNSYLMSLALPFLAVFGFGYLSSNRR